MPEGFLSRSWPDLRKSYETSDVKTRGAEVDISVPSKTKRHSRALAMENYEKVMSRIS